MTSSTSLDSARRIQIAIARRLYPNTGLRPEVLAAALRVSKQTVWCWGAGTATPSGPNLLELMAFFDDAFSLEISNGRCTKLKAPLRRSVRARRRHSAPAVADGSAAALLATSSQT